ncbi:MAG: aldose 1-epimerase family protein [Pseudonocardia sp.]|nr:aldose 1-epimerase family protein [Pseudonocardia sp.]
MLPTGEQYEIVSGDVRAVVTEVGAGLRALVHGERHLIETFPEDTRPARGMGAVLVPWPNRTRKGRWRWNGADQQLALTEPDAGNAIHGLLRHVLYRVGERSDDAITLRAVVPPQPGWPVALDTAVRFAVDSGGLTVTHTVHNVGDAPVPFGVGAHPYLRAGDTPTDDCVLTVAAARTIPLEGGLPTGPATAVPPALDLRSGRPVKELDLDNAYGGAAPADGDTRIRHHLAAPDATTELWADPPFGYVQVFTPPDLVGRGRAVAVEPMTCPPDALNTGDGLITLAADASWSGSWGIRQLEGT